MAISARAEVTAGTVRVMRARGVSRRARRIPRQAGTSALERDYAARLLSVVQLVEDALSGLFEELPDLVRSAQADRQRDDTVRLDIGEGERIRELIAELRDTMQDSLGIAELDQLAREIASGTSRFSRAQLGRQLRAALGVDVLQNDTGLASTVDSFVAQNVALIRDVPEKILTDVESTILRGLQRGTSNRDLTTQLQDKLAVGKRRARVIARDQIGTLNGQINARRQQNLGITHFVWRTVGDERVRPSHKNRDDQTFRFDDPPDGELPGEPINCRCFAEPVFDDILEEAA